jgi:hypothetical protein
VGQHLVEGFRVEGVASAPQLADKQCLDELAPLEQAFHPSHNDLERRER